MLTAIRGIDRTIWIGTGQGLYRFASPWQLEFWTQREGVKAAYSLLANGGKMYAGLERQIGVLSKDRQRWVALKSFVSPGIVMSLVPAGGGTLMAALNPGGVSQLRADGVILGRNKKIQNGLKLAQDGDGALWIGCEGLERIWPGGSVLKSKGQPLEIKPSSNMLDIQYEPKTQKLWGCYSGGLIVREPGDHWREFHKKDGLQTNPCWSLAALPNGDVWYGYFNVGAFALLRPDGRNGYSVRQYHAGGEIDDPESYIFDADQNGLLWRGGAKGISVADPASAEAGNWLYLDPSDGLPAAGVNNGAFLADSDGSVWWGADNTISHYTPPSDLIHPKFAPKVWVSAFSLNGGGAKLAESLDKIPNGAKTVAHIGSLQFERRNSLRLRYRVLPEQTNWTETRNLDVPLGTVSWGSHQLEVQGRIFGGLWSGTVTRSFSVLSPVWLSWPWPLVYFAGLLMSSTAIYFERRRRIADQQQIFPNLDDIRLKVFAPEVRKFAGQRFEERYEVRRHVGKGGFANVFIGYDYEEKRRCAIKIFRPEVSSSAALMRGFKQEVSALRKVRHRNVVEIYAHGIAAPETPYLVMEFIEGQSLRTILDEAGPLPRKRIARFLRQLAGALDAIHSIGICHRDLKPENLMVRQKEGTEEELVLIDFSIAIVKDATESIHGVSRAAGTFDYMAPEQAIGYARPSSDLYSLAKLLVEMLTGQRLAKLLPNAALDLPERIKQMATAMPWGLSADSVALLSAALEFDPTKRPDRAGDFARPIMKDLEAGD
jgi:tRNA A-37 threonylcarbamoyl transferase component Bud32